MSDISISKESIKDRLQNIVKVSISLEGDWDNEEYQVYIESICGSLTIDTPGGEDDIYLIKDCIKENAEMIFQDLTEAYIELVLIESGERQDVFWCKWYDIGKIVRHPLT